MTMHRTCGMILEQNIPCCQKEMSVFGHLFPLLAVLYFYLFISFSPCILF